MCFYVYKFKKIKATKNYMIRIKAKLRDELRFYSSRHSNYM